MSEVKDPVWTWRLAREGSKTEGPFQGWPVRLGKNNHLGQSVSED